MKKRIAIITIILCILLIDISFAQNSIKTGSSTSAKEALESLPTTKDTVDWLLDKDNSKNNKQVESRDKLEQNSENKNEGNDETISKISEIRNNEKQTLEDYQAAYGSETYGLTAYILNRIQVYSIPFCFLGIALSAIYQYVLGIRKLDTRDKGFAIMISIITVFVIAQVLPLIFAIVVKGWRG